MLQPIKKVLVGSAALAALALGGSALAERNDVVNHEHYDPERVERAESAEVRGSGARNPHARGRREARDR